jgi:hypothetical protein
VSGRDGDVLIADGVSGTDFRALGIESNRERTALSCLFGFTGVVDNALVVLGAKLGRSIFVVGYLVASMTKVHADNVHPGSTQLAQHFHAVGFWA